MLGLVVTGIARRVRICVEGRRTEKSGHLALWLYLHLKTDLKIRTTRELDTVQKYNRIFNLLFVINCSKI